jgi:hypothetical protein
MKKLMASLIIMATLITTPVYASEYPSLLRITEVQDNVVTGIDANGFTFRFVDVYEEWDVDDLCAVIFDDKGTTSIYDDEIRQTRYVGYADLYR